MRLFLIEHFDMPVHKGNGAIQAAWRIFNKSLLTQFSEQRRIMTSRLQSDPELFAKKDWLTLPNADVRQCVPCLLFDE